MTIPHTGTNRLDAIHLAPVDGVAAAARYSGGSFGCFRSKGLAGWVGAALSRPVAFEGF